MSGKNVKGLLIVGFAATLVVAAVVLHLNAPDQVTRGIHPKGVMGTTCTIVIHADKKNVNAFSKGPEQAERKLRHVEALMSSKLDRSAISIINTSPVNEPGRFPTEVMTVLREAKIAHKETGGAFDVTIGPLIELWKYSGRVETVPDEMLITQARQASQWTDFKLGDDDSVTRTRDTAMFDLGGIAKGFGIDQAVETMIDSGATAGWVDVGGDLRFFGQNPEGVDWSIKIRDPFDEDRILGRVHITEGSVCTSGNYNRYVTIGDQRFSHIIDPRTGMPADASPSVTVVAPTAIQADIWATALSVLGPDGLAKLPEGVHAMMLVGDDTSYETFMSDGFADIFVPVEAPIEASQE